MIKKSEQAERFCSYQIIIALSTDDTEITHYALKMIVMNCKRIGIGYIIDNWCRLSACGGKMPFCSTVRTVCLDPLIANSNLMVLPNQLWRKTLDRVLRLQQNVSRMINCPILSLACAAGTCVSTVQHNLWHHKLDALLCTARPLLQWQAAPAIWQWLILLPWCLYAGLSREQGEKVTGQREGGLAARGGHKGSDYNMCWDLVLR